MHTGSLSVNVLAGIVLFSLSGLGTSMAGVIERNDAVKVDRPAIAPAAAVQIAASGTSTCSCPALDCTPYDAPGVEVGRIKIPACSVTCNKKTEGKAVCKCLDCWNPKAREGARHECDCSSYDAGEGFRP